MELKLKNIGMIKEANVKINGLTVIAGENDTGKSTVGRALYYASKEYVDEKIEASVSIVKNKSNNAKKIGAIVGFGSALVGEGGLPLAIIGTLAGLGVGAIIDELNSRESSSSNTILQTKNSKIENGIKLNLNKNDIANVVMIETPYSLNFANYIKITQLLSQQRGLNYILADHIIDLVLQLSQTPLTTTNNLYDKITSIINGKLFYDEKRDNFFYKKEQSKEFDMNSTATGIKIFGFLQILLLNNTIKENTILILDEPEVHLHPKWQLEYAKIIVELVKNGVKILVTSHSPYIIEAIKRYSELEGMEDKTDFYLAENGYVEEQESLENIFEKLVSPFDELKKLKLEKYLND